MGTALQRRCMSPQPAAMRVRRLRHTWPAVASPSSRHLWRPIAAATTPASTSVGGSSGGACGMSPAVLAGAAVRVLEVRQAAASALEHHLHHGECAELPQGVVRVGCCMWPCRRHLAAQRWTSMAAEHATLPPLALLSFLCACG